MNKDNEIELVQTIQEKDKRIKELEERVKELELMYENTKRELIARTNKYIEVLEKLKGSVPKNKIREKIKELEKYIVETEEETCGRCITIGEDMTIRYLKELLEEG